MPLTDRSYWPGDDDHPQGDMPRCRAKPSKADVQRNRAMRRDAWECALPAGHESFGNARHHMHAWVQTGEDE